MTTDPARFLRDHWGRVQEIAQSICRRGRLSAEDTEEFLSEIKLKLLDDDYRVLRLFSGGSSIETYLTSVINRKFLDDRRAVNGRWRPSKRAVELGHVAVALERLTNHQHYPLHEALEILASQTGTVLAYDQAQALLHQLPLRDYRPVEIDIDDVVIPGGTNPEKEFFSGESLRLLQTVQAIVRELSAEFSVQDRLLLRLTYEDGIRLTAVAEQLGMGRKEAERRLQKILAGFKRELLQRGLNQSDIVELLRGEAC